MLCSICQSDQHFRMKCPHGNGKGGKAGNNSSSFPASSSSWDPNAWSQPDITYYPAEVNVPESSSPQPLPSDASTMMLGVGRTRYFAIVTQHHQEMSQIFFSGTPPIQLSEPVMSCTVASSAESEIGELLHHSLSQLSQAKFEHHKVAFAWWEHQEFQTSTGNDTTYHSQVKLPRGEALLIDTGAVQNLSGDHSVNRMAATAKEHGHGTQFSALPRVMIID